MPYDARLTVDVVGAIDQTFAPGELDELTRLVLARPLTQIALPDPFGGGTSALVRQVVDYANRRDLLGALVGRAREARPDSVELMAAAEPLGLSSTGRVIPRAGQTIDRTKNLEKLVRGVPQRVSMAVFLGRAAPAEARVCRIQIDRGGQPPQVLGTGFLIRPDQVLTNHHVIKDVLAGTFSPQALCFLFDYKTDVLGAVIHPGTAIGPGAKWCEKWRPHAPGDVARGAREADTSELDYALLNLERAIGDEKIIADGIAAAKPRGFFDLAKLAAPAPASEPVFVLGHPEGEPLTVSMGTVLKHVAQGRRIHYDAYTLGGSSGSPVFDAGFELMALHHAGDPADGPAQFNQGIPLGLIAQDIAAG